jgi:DNA primase
LKRIPGTSQKKIPDASLGQDRKNGLQMQIEDYLDRYTKCLFNGSIESDMALNYLLGSRGLKEDTIRELDIGYCSRGSEVPGATAEQRKENSVMKGRVVMPIREEFGGMLALAARQPSPAAKGWWNQHFTKGNHIFLFDKSRRYAYEKDKMYIVEGYFDAIIPWQYGLKNIGCLMGTALGMRRIGLIARYCENICIMLDTDESKDGKEGAGQKAQRRFIAELSLAGFNGITKIDLPVKVDADEFVISNGIEALLGLEKPVSSAERSRAKKEYLADRNGRS